MLDGRLLRANGALLTVAEPARPPWIPWVSGLPFAFGATLILAAVLFLWSRNLLPNVALELEEQFNSSVSLVTDWHLSSLSGAAITPQVGRVNREPPTGDLLD